jgi:hypothetical protein
MAAFQATNQRFTPRDESRGNAGEPMTPRFKAAAAFQLDIRIERAPVRCPQNRP